MKRQLEMIRSRGINEQNLFYVEPTLAVIFKVKLGIVNQVLLGTNQICWA